MSYAELLRDPRWQKKRLEVLSEASFECSSCGSGEVELHVHHSVYRRGRKPWEYDLGELECLCKNCHAEIERIRDNINSAMLLAGMCSDGLGIILGMANAFAWARGPLRRCPCANYEEATGIGAVWGLTAEAVLELLPQGADAIEESALVDACKSAHGGLLPLHIVRLIGPRIA